MPRTPEDHLTLGGVDGDEGRETTRWGWGGPLGVYFRTHVTTKGLVF